MGSDEGFTGDLVTLSSPLNVELGLSCPCRILVRHDLASGTIRSPYFSRLWEERDLKDWGDLFGRVCSNLVFCLSGGWGTRGYRREGLLEFFFSGDIELGETEILDLREPPGTVQRDLCLVYDRHPRLEVTKLPPLGVGGCVCGWDCSESFSRLPFSPIFWERFKRTVYTFRSVGSSPWVSLCLLGIYEFNSGGIPRGRLVNSVGLQKCFSSLNGFRETHPLKIPLGPERRRGL